MPPDVIARVRYYDVSAPKRDFTAVRRRTIILATSTRACNLRKRSTTSTIRMTARRVRERSERKDC